MSSKCALVINCLAAAAMSIAGPAVSAAARGPCELPAASAAGGASPDDATHASLLANWDVRGWQRHRIWITLQADNRGDAEARVLPLMALAARADAGATTWLAGLPMTLAPHARATQRMTVYVPEDTKTLGLRLVPAAPTPAPAPDVAAAFALECSDARFDPGQVAAAVAPLLQEALSTWFDGGRAGTARRRSHRRGPPAGDRTRCAGARRHGRRRAGRRAGLVAGRAGPPACAMNDASRLAPGGVVGRGTAAPSVPQACCLRRRASVANMPRPASSRAALPGSGMAVVKASPEKAAPSVRAVPVSSK